MRIKRDNIIKWSLIAISSLTIIMLIWILGYIFINGFSYIKLKELIPPIVSTLYMVAISLLISTPIGIGAAIYLNEYAKKGPFIKIIRFALETLAALPSILFGLFGMLFFLTQCKLGFSIFTGALTVSLMIFPIIVKTTEEALKTVSVSLREGSLSLGAGQVTTIMKVVLPSAIPGILTGIILGIGRVVGETAAIYLTAGTMFKLPVTPMDSGRTLAVHLYLLAKEGISFDEAYGTAVVLLITILLLNLITYFIGYKLKKVK